MPTASGSSAILQVTSLSITFTLAYEPSSSTTAPSPPGHTLAASFSSLNPARITATTPLPTHHPKPSRTRRKKPNRKTTQPTRSAQVSSGSDLDDNHDGDDSSTTAVESDHAPSGSGQAITRMLAGRRDSSPSRGSRADSSGRPHFATLLSRGLAVTVNGSPWRSVAAHVGEGVDEAVVVVYGLSPGREYNVELGLVGDEEGKIQTETTPAAATTTMAALDPTPMVNTTSSAISTSSTRTRSRANSLRSRSRANSSSSSQQPPITIPPPAQPALPTLPPPPPTPPPRTMSPAAPAKPDAPLTAEALTVLLKQRLAESEAQHSVLSADLKAHRRTSQKNESHLRTTIATFQKTLEKSAAGDLRARQKVLALGESVKRLIAGKEDVTKLESEIWDELGDLEEQEERSKAEWDKVSKESAEVERNRDEVVGGNEKLLAEWEGELGGLVGKLDKLNGKHDRLTHQVGTLNDHLRAISKERDDLTSGSHPILLEAASNMASSSRHHQSPYYNGSAQPPQPPQQFNHESAYPHHYGQGPYPAPAPRPPQMIPPGRGGYGGVVPPQHRQQQIQQQQQQSGNGNGNGSNRPPYAGGAPPPPPSLGRPASGPTSQQAYSTPNPSPTTSGSQQAQQLQQPQSSPTPSASYRPTYSSTSQPHPFSRPMFGVPSPTSQPAPPPSSSPSSFSPFGDVGSAQTSPHRGSPFSPSFANATPIGRGSNPPSRQGSISAGGGAGSGGANSPQGGRASRQGSGSGSGSIGAGGGGGGEV